jgi:hypothetical protein
LVMRNSFAIYLEIGSLLKYKRSHKPILKGHGFSRAAKVGLFSRL